MSRIILHHYDTSPFSEKPRTMFGIKGLAWGSVIQPVIMPKPDLIPLTGGYRRIPVMQVGADIYCDSQVILAEIERRHPDPPVVQGGDWAANLAADRLWFQASVAVIFAVIGDNIPEDFKKDREQLSGRPFDAKAMQAAAPIMKPQWRAHAAHVEDGLARDDFLGGSTPSVSDLAAWMNIWWTRGAARPVYDELTRGLPRLAAWAERMRSLGHGTRTDLTPADALAAAQAAEPETTPAHDADDPTGLKPGDAAMVMADDYGRDPIKGTIAALTRDRAILARDDPGLGRIHVHFPRAGYIVAAG